MRSIWFFGCLVRDLSPRAGAGSGYALLEITAPPGSQPPPHIHHRDDEGFCVLEGEMSVFTAAGGGRPCDRATT
jgi:mannose-6-phosphate isomerase-like protein (cupin superfamily)